MSQLKKAVTVGSALVFLSIFTVKMVIWVAVNADALYPFSFAKDLLTHVPIKNWHFPGPFFFFPDILISIPLVALLKTPVAWSIGQGIIQSLWLVITVAVLTNNKKHLPFHIRFCSSVYLLVLTYIFVQFFLHGAWLLSAGKAFIAVNHFGAAMLAFTVFILINPKKINFLSSKKIIFILIAVIISAFSDVFFMLYLFGFTLSYFSLHPIGLIKNKRFLTIVSLVAILGGISLAIAIKINPAFSVEAHSHKISQLLEIKEKALFFWENMRYGVILLISLPVALFTLSLIFKQYQVIPIPIGMLFVGLILFLLGFFFHIDISALRYLVVYFPSTVYFVYELMPVKIIKMLSSYAIGIIAVIFTIIYYHLYLQDGGLKNNTLGLPNKTILTCSELKPALKSSVLISTYWTAKPLFEYTNREASLIEIDQLAPRNWIVNPAWQNIVKYPKKVIIVAHHVNPIILKKVRALPQSKLLCDGHLIQVQLTPRLAKIFPVLSQYEKNNAKN